MPTFHQFSAMISNLSLIRRLLVAAGFATALSAPDARAKNADGSQLLGHAWAGDPVSFSLLTERDHQFVAYYDENRRLAVAGRMLGSDDWTTVKPEGHPVPTRSRNSNETGWDSHNYLRLVLDREDRKSTRSELQSPHHL